MKNREYILIYNHNDYSNKINISSASDIFKKEVVIEIFKEYLIIRETSIDDDSKIFRPCKQNGDFYKTSTSTEVKIPNGKYYFDDDSNEFIKYVSYEKE